MEIVIPSGPAGMDFDFNSPRPSAPSSPKRFGQYYYTSAPTSPSRVSEFYQEFDSLYMMNNYAAATNSSSSSAAIPFGWEQTPGTPKSPKEDDFDFNFSAELEQSSLSAEELFDGGKIRPLKPPPRLQADYEYDSMKSPLLSPRSPNPFSQGKRIIREVFSPRNKKKSADPFAQDTRKKTEPERGRQRRNDLSSGSRRATRSLSPYRVSEYPWEEEEEEEKQQQQQQRRKQQPPPIKQHSSFNNSKPPPPSSHPPPSSTKSSSRKWRFTDFLLFRSASEGRAADKDPLRKYSIFKRHEDTKNNNNTSSRSSEGSGSGRRKGQVSAHELHYTKNKAASQDLKKKTFLPYKSRILGFHGLGSFSRS